MEAHTMDVGTRLAPIEFLGFMLKGVFYGFNKVRYQRIANDPECLIYIHAVTATTYRVFMSMHENVYLHEDSKPHAIQSTYATSGSLLDCERAIRAQRGRPFPWECDV